ncbi:MAG TPA: EVE domain-containing protein [Candidatus Polarisedimenticolia bacterium]|nr:EVE domain-containing protein [Candidatus Polarisedimenticolia bacterium]
MPIQRWILKTEPSEYSFGDLQNKKRDTWSGVRNPLALKYLRSARAGDLALVYHTGKEKSAVGIARIVGAPYPDPAAKDSNLTVVDLEPVRPLDHPVPLAEIKRNPKLKSLELLRISRLSVSPVSREHWNILMKMSGGEA